MKDERIARLAGQQFNRVSRTQLASLGASDFAIAHRVANGRLVVVEEGVFAVAPVLKHDDRGRWMGATLTAANTRLCRESAACAQGILEYERDLITVVRPGNGGPRRHGGLLVYRSGTLEGECTEVDGIPVTSVPRTLLDLACCVSDKALARALRGAAREHVTLTELGDRLGDFWGRKGSRRLARAIARYSDLPLERARSGAEIRALEVLKAAGRPMPRLNVCIAGEEADLSWPREHLIVEIDGRTWHQDKGEDARKEAAWRGAGWTVRRIDSDDVYEHPHLLLALAPM
jgi:Protein of unknown function (DUF559)